MFKEQLWPHARVPVTIRVVANRPEGVTDCAEGLMGHKLPGSRGSYFDYHDANFAAEEYMRGFWQRIAIDRIRDLEDEIGELRKEKEKRKELEVKVTVLKQRLNGLTKPKKTIDTVMTSLLEDPEVQDLLKKKLKDLL